MGWRRGAMTPRACVRAAACCDKGSASPGRTLWGSATFARRGARARWAARRGANARARTRTRTQTFYSDCLHYSVKDEEEAEAEEEEEDAKVCCTVS